MDRKQSTGKLQQKKEVNNISGSLKYSKTKMKRMIKENPELKDVIEKIRNEIVDEAEKSLLKRIREGNITSIIFALKTLGRSRGYASTGNGQPAWMKILTKAELNKLNDEQLSHLEKLLKKGKNPTDYLIGLGINVPSD